MAVKVIEGKTIDSWQAPRYSGKMLISFTDGTRYEVRASGMPPTLFLGQVCAECGWNEDAHRVHQVYGRIGQYPFPGICNQYLEKITSDGEREKCG